MEEYRGNKTQRKIRGQVIRLINNKMQPLASKFHVLKSSNSSSVSSQLDQSTNSCQDIKNSRSSKYLQKIKSRRKALVNLAQQNEAVYFQMLQKKVEKHIAMKRIGLMEEKYLNSQQLKVSKEKEGMRKLGWRSPLEKYIELFSSCEKPSQKIKMSQVQSCDKILKKIKSVKTTKNIECADENTKCLKNLEHQPKRKTKKQRSQKEVKRSNEKNLKKLILKDIKQQYQNQETSKLKISINHKKMILLK